MTETQAGSWAYAAAAAGVTVNALFIAFYASFAVQHFAEPRGVTAILGSAADYAGVPQNALLAVITGVVFRFLSRQQRSDQVLRIAGAIAFATAAAQGVLTVTGLLSGVSAHDHENRIPGTRLPADVACRHAGIADRVR